MPYEVNYENEGRGVVIKWTGFVYGSEIFAVNGQIYAGEQFPILSYQIWDFSEAKRLDASYSDARNLAIQDAKATAQNPNMLSALVGRPDFFYGLQRVYIVLTEVWAKRYKVEYFSEIEEARAWIAKKYPDL